MTSTFRLAPASPQLFGGLVLAAGLMFVFIYRVSVEGLPVAERSQSVDAALWDRRLSANRA